MLILLPVFLSDNTGNPCSCCACAGLLRKRVVTNARAVCCLRCRRFCSDGVFEFLSNETVCEIVGHYKGDPMKATKAVVAEAYRLWLQYEVRTDDITARSSPLVFPADIRCLCGPGLCVRARGKEFTQSDLGRGGPYAPSLVFFFVFFSFFAVHYHIPRRDH